MTDRRRLLILIAVAGLLVLILLTWAVLRPKPVKPGPPPPIPVTAVKVSSQDVPIVISALGAAQAWTSDTILAQVSGKLLRVNFSEGTDVTAGQPLAEVDPAPYRAALVEAQGTLQRDQATLAGAQTDLARYRRLEAKDSIARQTVDDEAATVAQEKGTVLLDQGALAAARINLQWCTIRSPIAGRTGVRLVDPGNLVSASGGVGSTPSTTAPTSASSSSASSSATSGAGGSSGGGASATGIVIVNQIQPIAVTFTVPEGDFEQLLQLSNGFRKALAVQAFSQESGALLDAGEVRIADNRVDPTTGTVELKARFPNAARRLWPGQFVDVRMTTQTLTRAVTIPTSAVNRGPRGPFAFIVGADGKARPSPLTLATTQGDTVVVKSGVKPGDTVVTDGQMVLKSGSSVKILAPQRSPAAP